MSDLQSIEQRLFALELAMAEMQRRSGTGLPKPNWLDLIGSVHVDEDAFREALEYGKECRRTGRLPEDELEEP